jgi:nicotinic acid mononucleotide adenylyltransferase
MNLLIFKIIVSSCRFNLVISDRIFSSLSIQILVKVELEFSNSKAFTNYMDSSKPYGLEVRPTLLGKPLSLDDSSLQFSSMSQKAIISGLSTPVDPESLGDFGAAASIVRHALSVEACETIVEESIGWPWTLLDTLGNPIEGKSGNVSTDSAPCVGPFRAMIHDEDVANALWDQFRTVLKPKQDRHSDIPFDKGTHNLWKPVRVSPLLHFTRFEYGGATTPHYHHQLDCRNGESILTSMIFMLTPQSLVVGGRTRLLLDFQRWMPSDERNFCSHSTFAFDRDVLVEARNDLGDCLLLDRDVLRDDSMWKDRSSSRILMHADVLYERITASDPEPATIVDKIPPQAGDTPTWLDQTYRKAMRVIGGSIAALENAGCYDDGLPGDHEWDPRWWTGPTDKIHKNLSKVYDTSKRLAVLVSTGSFCPVHKGHLQMMENAKVASEANGLAVLGGYLCPDHDGYVSAKLHGDALSIAERFHLCEKAVAESSWLMVDRSASLSTHVNFTRVLDHISRRLARDLHTHRPIHVIYVYGSDHARFAQAFVCRGSCICVLREGSDAPFTKFSANPYLRSSLRIMFCRNSTLPLSSTSVRRGDTSALPDVVKPDWQRVQSARANMPIGVSKPLNLYIRDEGSWAVRPWIHHGDCGSGNVTEAYAIFSAGLQKTFAKSFSSVQPPVELVMLPLEMQRKIYDESFTDSQVISLDPCLPSTANLQISRYYKPFSIKSHQYGPRPGAPTLETQINDIRPGTYDLFDDDCFSGQTAKFAIAQLSPRCVIRSFRSLCDSDGPLSLDRENRSHRLRLNNVDCRDFLVGSREGGLVLQLPDDSICRAPYVLPYVSPHNRASIPVAAEIEFSRDVWRLNKDFFASLEKTLLIKDMSPAFQRLCSSLRFGADDGMVDLCNWHIEKLN